MKWIALVLIWLVCGAVALFALHGDKTGWYVVGSAVVALVATWTIVEEGS